MIPVILGESALEGNIRISGLVKLTQFNDVMYEDVEITLSRTDELWNYSVNVSDGSDMITVDFQVAGNDESALMMAKTLVSCLAKLKLPEIMVFLGKITAMADEDQTAVEIGESLKLAQAQIFDTDKPSG